MAKGFGKKEAVVLALVLLISITSLVISVVTVILHGYRYSSLLSKVQQLEKACFSSDKNEFADERNRRNSQGTNDVITLWMDNEIRRKVHKFMENLHQIYCPEKSNLVIVGAKGEPGNSGQKGSLGPPGPKGEMGLKGSSSAKGEKGDPGISISKPVIIKPPKSVVVEPGPTSITISCVADGLPTPQITWYRLTAEMPSGNHVIHGNGTLTFTRAVVGQQGVYVCLAKNVLGEAKAFFSINIIMPSEFVNKPQRVAVKVGSRVTLHCIAKGYPLPTITWYKGNQTNRGVPLKKNMTTLIVTNALSNDSGIYTCLAQNIVNKIEAKAKVSVLERLNFTIKPPKKAIGHMTQSLLLDCQAWCGIVQPEISWKKEDGYLNDHQVFANGTLLLNITSQSDAGNYSCVATNALVSINTTVSVEVYIRSCSEWKMSGESLSGYYVIDSDGPGGQSPFRIYCDMSGNDGVTVLSHDSEMRSKVEGYSRPVLLWHGLVPYGWWVSRDGKKMDYWGGAAPGSWKCACGMENSCNSGHVCNCDVNDGVWREDSGLLTDKNTLPVSQLRFGDTGDPRHEKGYFTLGKFRCFGIEK